MKHLLTAGALALVLSGCASFDAAVESFNKPATQQALSTVRTATATVACILSQSQNKKTIAYAVEKNACLLAGGVLQ